jgi:hypothetical protein
MEDSCIISNVNKYLTDILMDDSDGPLTAEKFQSRLAEIRSTLCAAMRLIDSHNDDLLYAIRNGLFEEFAEVQSWTMSQLPNGIGTLVAEARPGMMRSMGGSHGRRSCYCNRPH